MISSYRLSSAANAAHNFIDVSHEEIECLLPAIIEELQGERDDGDIKLIRCLIRDIQIFRKDHPGDPREAAHLLMRRKYEAPELEIQRKRLADLQATVCALEGDAEQRMKQHRQLHDAVEIAKASLENIVNHRANLVGEIEGRERAYHEFIAAPSPFDGRKGIAMLDAVVGLKAILPELDSKLEEAKASIKTAEKNLREFEKEALSK